MSGIEQASNQPLSLRLSRQNTRVRQTPHTSFGDVMNTTIHETAKVAKQAAPYIPGGTIVSAALAGTGNFQSRGQTATGIQSSGLGSAGYSAVGGAPSLTGGPSANAGGSAFSGTSNYGSALGSGGATPTGDAGSGIPGHATPEIDKQKENIMLSADVSTKLMMMQYEIQNESRYYMTVSNIMKTRHDTAKNSIQNIR